MVEVLLNQTSFQTGEQLEASLHVINGAAPQDVEARVWVETPDGAIAWNLTVPRRSLAPHADVTVPVLNYFFAGTEPAGTYLVGARLMEPVTGHSWSADEKAFSFAP